MVGIKLKAGHFGVWCEGRSNETFSVEEVIFTMDSKRQGSRHFKAFNLLKYLYSCVAVSWDYFQHRRFFYTFSTNVVCYVGLPLVV